MKKESAEFVRVPIMAVGLLLLICNCALAQKELVIEYTAESERMRCTIEEYVQNGDEISDFGMKRTYFFNLLKMKMLPLKKD